MYSYSVEKERENGMLAGHGVAHGIYSFAS
jgi:hypothetical protein